MTANKPEVEDNEQRVAEGEEEQPPKLQKNNEDTNEKEASSNNMDTNEAGTSSGSNSSNNKEELMKKATNALVQGKRHFFMKDIPSAVAALEDACRLQVEIYGPLSSEHAEAHFYFGRALLEQARLDLAVFDAPNAGVGDTTNGKSDEEDSEDGEDEDEEEEEGGEDEEMEGEEEAVENGTKESSSSDDKPSGAKENDDEKEQTTTTDDKKTVEKEVKEEEESSSEKSKPTKVSEGAKPSSSSSSISATVIANDDEQPSTSKGGGNMSTLTETAEDEPNNLELAWEVLELAKIGYLKQLENVQMKLNDSINNEENTRLQKTLVDIKRKLADTHSLLGEVGTESEIYQQAIEDFKTAITIYSDVEEEDSREIAQIKFQIGLTYGLEKNWKESIENLQESAAMIQKRVDNLKKKLSQLTTTTTSTNNPECNNEATTATNTNSSNERENIEKEIQELTELLPELQEKINDTIEQEKDLKKVEEEEKMEQEIMERNSPVKKQPPAKPLDSGLIKRKEKRKVELESVPLGQVIDGAHPPAFGNEEPPSKKPCTDSTSIDTPASLTTSTNGHAKPE